MGIRIKTPPKGGVDFKHKLFTQTQAGNQCTVSIRLSTAQVRQQATTLANHFQQAATAVVVFRVGFEVRSQVVDAERLVLQKNRYRLLCVGNL